MKQTLDYDGLAEANVICRKLPQVGRKTNGQTVLLQSLSTFQIYVNVQIQQKNLSFTIQLKFEEVLSQKSYDHFIKQTAQEVVKILKNNNITKIQTPKYARFNNDEKKLFSEIFKSGIKIFVLN